MRKEFLGEMAKALTDTQCVGCGYCCRTAPCGLAWLTFSPAIKTGVWKCPALRWDGKRYLCRLCEGEDAQSKKNREALAIGAGCSSTLFNQDRQRIPPPEKEVSV